MPQRVTPDLLSRLLAEHGGALALMAANRCAAPDDCVQEAFVELAKLPTPPENPAAWLFARVRQRAINAARAARRRSEHEQTAWRDRLAPAGEAIDRGEVLDLVQALAALDADERELVTLRFYSGLSYAEVAALVGGSKSAVHRATEAAIEKLRAILITHQGARRT
ncbi:MAG: sigma-70 family RNA polymerase sigma factor [Lacipirellulaceae bacterium]